MADQSIFALLEMVQQTTSGDFVLNQGVLDEEPALLRKQLDQVTFISIPVDSHYLTDDIRVAALQIMLKSEDGVALTDHGSSDMFIRVPVEILSALSPDALVQLLLSAVDVPIPTESERSAMSTDRVYLQQWLAEKDAVMNQCQSHYWEDLKNEQHHSAFAFLKTDGPRVQAIMWLIRLSRAIFSYPESILRASQAALSSNPHDQLAVPTALVHLLGDVRSSPAAVCSSLERLNDVADEVQMAAGYVNRVLALRSRCMPKRPPRLSEPNQTRMALRQREPFDQAKLIRTLPDSVAKSRTRLTQLWSQQRQALSQRATAAQEVIRQRLTAITPAQGVGRRVMRDALNVWRTAETTATGSRVDMRRGPRAQGPIHSGIHAQRSQNQLEYLLKQTQFYSHFMARKVSAQQLEDMSSMLPEKGTTRKSTIAGVTDGTATDATISAAAAQRVLEAAARTEKHMQQYGMNTSGEAIDTANIEAPTLFNGFLKPYQLAGVRWLASLWATGLNGILGDDMGLGKTIQTLAFLAWLAEAHGIYGPFLIVTPPSTLHNWVSEAQRFVPGLKTRPYWGSAPERQAVAKTWHRATLGWPQAAFHILVTSYQILVKDTRVLRSVRWQYVCLDEAQAIKNSDTQRWRALLDFPCRNRLLLSGTPFQNNLREVWALLNFIMPTLFNDLTDFMSWFGQSTTASSSSSLQLDPTQLERLHELLKPFMLRRVKRDVERELGEKHEVLVRLQPAPAQQRMLRALSEHATVTNLLRSATQRGDFDAELAATGPSAAPTAQNSDVDEHTDAEDELNEIIAEDKAMSEDEEEEPEPEPDATFDDEAGSDISQAVNEAPRRGRKPRPRGDSFQPQTPEATLMNLLMQGRKICNHPVLFRRLEFMTPVLLMRPEYTLVPPYPLTDDEKGISNLRVAAATREIIVPVSVSHPIIECWMPRCVETALEWRADRARISTPRATRVVEVRSVATTPVPDASTGIEELTGAWTAVGDSNPSGVLHQLLHAPRRALLRELGTALPADGDSCCSLLAAPSLAAARLTLLQRAHSYRVVHGEQQTSVLPSVSLPLGGAAYPTLGLRFGDLAVVEGRPEVRCLTGAAAALSHLSSGVSTAAFEPVVRADHELTFCDPEVPSEKGGARRNAMVGFVGVAPFFSVELAQRGLCCYQPGVRVMPPERVGTAGPPASNGLREYISRQLNMCLLGRLYRPPAPLLGHDLINMHCYNINMHGDLVLEKEPESSSSEPDEAAAESQATDVPTDVPADAHEGDTALLAPRYATLGNVPPLPQPLFAPVPKDLRPSAVRLWDRTSLVADSSKLKYLDKLLPELAANHHRVLLYSQMARVLDVLGDFLTYRGFRYLRLDGSCNVQERHALVSRFSTDPSIFAFLLTTRAGGVGINLVAADTVILYDSDPNPTFDMQAVDRAHRLGQTKPVTVYRLCTVGTVEERILLLAEAKKSMQGRLLDAAEQYSDRLFSSGAAGQKEGLRLLLGDEEVTARARRVVRQSKS